MRSLREESARAAERLDEANRAFDAAPGEQQAAWARLQGPLHGRQGAHTAGDQADRRFRRGGAGRRRVLLLGLGFGALAAVGVILWFNGAPRRPREGSSPAPSAPIAWSAPGAPWGQTGKDRPRGLRAPVAVPVPRRAPDGIVPEGPNATRALPEGRSVLAGGIRARLAARGAATVRTGREDRAEVVALQSGALEIEIDPGPPAAAPAAPAQTARLAVQVAAYRLEADPGRFSVVARDGKIDVAVHRGRLVIWSSRRVLATVVAGQRWTNRPAGTARRSGDGDSGGITGNADNIGNIGNIGSEVAAETPDCARLTRAGAIDEALACFGRESQHPGLVGELALMELARIRRDVKGDLAGAERALAEHRRRYPHGALADEAAGARVELLLRLARPAEALAEAERLTGGDAIFWRGVCLAKLGRRPEAARAFDDYVARPDGKRRAEAVRRRQELAR
jgi:ferric-dicitrate binding protein FerR (iron transport regulator)